MLPLGRSAAVGDVQGAQHTGTLQHPGVWDLLGLAACSPVRDCVCASRMVPRGVDGGARRSRMQERCGVRAYDDRRSGGEWMSLCGGGGGYKDGPGSWSVTGFGVACGL